MRSPYYSVHTSENETWDPVNSSVEEHNELQMAPTDTCLFGMGSFGGANVPEAPTGVGSMAETALHWWHRGPSVVLSGVLNPFRLGIECKTTPPSDGRQLILGSLLCHAHVAVKVHVCGVVVRRPLQLPGRGKRRGNQAAGAASLTEGVVVLQP